MGLIQDNRPRDWAYKAVFKEKDLPSLEEMARRIRETHDVSIIEDFNQKCEQKLQRQGEKAVLDNGLEIESVTKSGDLVVNTGLQQCLNIILGTSSARFSHFGFSPGNIPAPAVTDTALLAETVAQRVVLSWSESVGMRLYFGGISSQTSGSAPNQVGEIGVYNGAAAGAILLNRTSWPTTTLSPAQNTTSFSTIKTAPVVVSCVVQFCPVV